MLRRTKTKFSGPVTEFTLRRWLIEQVADRVGLDPAEVDTARSFEEYGLDSRATVQLSGTLEKIVDLRLSPVLLYEHPTIDAVSAHLAEQLRLGDAG